MTENASVQLQAVTQLYERQQQRQILSYQYSLINYVSGET